MSGLFNYDRDMMEPPEEREELDPGGICIYRVWAVSLCR